MITIIIFCGSSWWGGPEHGAGGAEKGAFFDFYGTITTSGNLLFDILEKDNNCFSLFDILVWRHFLLQSLSRCCST
ncbi:hypothetical protein E8R50_14845 [Escherichia coli]|nr:hypothetical protein E8R50_14845 [Escherichia coli]